MILRDEMLCVQVKLHDPNDLLPVVPRTNAPDDPLFKVMLVLHLRPALTCPM